MKLIDTHAHIYLKRFDNDRESMMQRAFDQGIDRVYLPNIDRESIDDMLQLERDYPDHCFAMMGLHPCSVKENYREELEIVREWIDRRSFRAIGEIGLDLYWDKTFFSQQQDAFRIQMEWAIEKDWPIVIHSRESTQEVLQILREMKHPKLRGIFHCFGGSIEEAEAIIETGFYLGIGGVLTFKRSGLDATMKGVDLRHVVLETDAPYLAPVPFRGKRNETGYVRFVAEKLAEIKGISLEEVAAITSKNALDIFEKMPNN